MLSFPIGDPKGIVRDSGGYAVALKYTADKIYDIQPGDTWWASSEFGWVVGHSYCCYAPLLQRATTIIYEVSTGRSYLLSKLEHSAGSILTST